MEEMEKISVEKETESMGNTRSETSFLSLQNLVKIYPNGAKAVFNFDLDIAKNEFIVIVGPSGCGKSTTLRMIAGLEEISSGDIYLENELLNYRPSKDRNIAIVFQSYALYPQMNVFDNIAFPLTINKYPYHAVDYTLLALNEAIKVLNEQYASFINAYADSLNKKATKMDSDEYLSLRLKIDVHTAELLCKNLKVKKLNREELLANEESIKEELISKFKAAIALKEGENATNGIVLNDKFEKVDSDGKPIIEYRKMTDFEIKKKVFETAKTLDLGDYLDRLPKELSGGQMQRVALGRAIVKNVPLFLMDEPLSNLDAKLRLVMRSEIVKLHNLINATTIYVTHDQTEAMTMASRIVVMSRGFVQQIGTPNEVYDNPANLFVAKFIGSPSINIFDGVYKDGTVTFDRASIKLDNDLIARHDDFYAKTLEEFENINVDFDRESSEYILKILSALNDEKKVVEKQVKPHFFTRFISLFKKNKEEENHISFSREQDVCLQKIEDLKQIEGNEHSLLFAVRPEKLKIRVLEDGDNKLADNEIEVTVTVSELLGSEYHVHFDFAGHDMVAKFSKEERKVSMGDRLAISFDIKDVFIFDPITGGRIY